MLLDYTLCSPDYSYKAARLIHCIHQTTATRLLDYTLYSPDYSYKATRLCIVFTDYSYKAARLYIMFTKLRLQS